MLKRLLDRLPDGMSSSGEVLSDEPLRRGLDIGYIPQQYTDAFLPFLTMRQMLRDTYRAHGRKIDQPHIDDVLRTLELDSAWLDLFPSELSGGQLQRFAILFAVALKPRLILADELTTALDPVLTRRLLDWLTEYQHQYGATILFVTHELGPALHYGDQLVLMQEGRIVETGTPEMIEQSRHPFTMTLMQAHHTTMKERKSSCHLSYP
ncbi:ATP-binding cassette domain-containing protein [Exiguobacterium sp. SL14]|nr:AAA family ATPase [Exiguobacterium sp. SL14]MCY1691055.1 ATP-binding cassette domain-containing protein [Exiguobacterium sp. SL14]